MVGAGPVGMLTALFLSRSGVEVEVIDQEWHTAAHSYACALHPRTLKLLDQLGLATDVVKLGRRIDTFAFYEGDGRRAEVKLSRLPTDFPFVLVVPQDELESILERRLYQQARVKVRWNHRLSDLRAEEDSVVAAIDRLSETALGYAYPDWDWTVEKKVQTRAEFVIGADGHNSIVRQDLGLALECLPGEEFFEVYEFDAEGEVANEVRVVFDKATTNVMWPLGENRCRWSFQFVPEVPAREFPSKERMAIMFAQEAVNEQTKKRVQKLLLERAPWFKGGIRALDWAAEIRFEPQLVKEFGRGRCWLVGDAAHQTGPAGVQSMNVGLNEAADLAAKLKRILREKAPLTLLEAYHQERQGEWQSLLGLKGGLKPRAQTDPWTKDHRSKILPCLPASGEDLARLAEQLGLDFG